MTADLEWIQGDPECRYRHIDAQVGPSPDPDAAYDVACFMSTDTVDADDEVLLPEGADLSRFERNPVVLLCHAYGQPGCYYPLPVGRAEWTKKRPRGLLAGVRFTDKTPMGREVKALFDDGMLRSFSVGFRPVAASPMTREEAATRPDWQAAFERTRGHILVHRKWHLLELSVAPVPSNPDALVTRYKAKGIALPAWLSLPKTLEAAMLQPASAEGTEAVASRSAQVVEGPWDAEAAVASVRAWASSDGSGAPETIDWDRYAGAFLWRDASDPAAFASYRLPVKRVEDGSLVVVDEALRAAAAALDGGREGVAIPESDRSAVRRVLAQYEQDKGQNPAASADDHALPVDPPRAFVSSGDPVRIAAPHFAGAGQVVSLHDRGLVPDVPNDLVGTESEPAARVRCFKSVGDGFVATDHHVGVLCKHLERVDPLPPPSPVPLKSTASAEPLPPLVPLSEPEAAAEAIAKLDRLLSTQSIRAMVRAELDRRMGYV